MVLVYVSPFLLFLIRGSLSLIFFKESNLTHDPIDLKHDGNFCRSFLRFRLEIGRTVPKALDDRIRNKACYARDRVCEAMVVHRIWCIARVDEVPRGHGACEVDDALRGHGAC